MSRKIKYLVSACLCSIPCRFDGTGSKDSKMERLVRAKKALPICPEILGGLAIPREAVEIARGEGKDVLNGSTKVVSRTGEDVTPFFLRGTFTSLAIAKNFKIKKAWMKKNSPSCGCGWIKRKGKLVKGDGVTVALFKREGIRVMSR
jgi:uncharacterized protein YbbK (DUF523 family)